ncbi:bifunctional (p)ppGpp synthetase/guanosine-3',5'-bis(diphosphate) 3'-pyrophosphohydrolase [Clostridiaceae bacterium HSG29]|nr:bifunctional (p)ppGpp synthetase/guanosine-3',5'-bis(diphosphate) 3'-pyrophosphohydrolase [Clostridiaceae bacterium HSG29]
MIVIDYNTYINELVKLNDEYNIDNIKKVYYFAKEAHEGQKRKSGEDYFIHPIAVSLILAGMKMDEETIIASILHDVVEDTKYSKEEISEIFGETIALLVDGVTKLTNLRYESKEIQKGENLRKMFLAMAKDIRVVLIKLADRLHNMRTLEYMSVKKKQEKAMETLEIYAPIADRLGMSQIRWELEDISFSYLHLDEYHELVEKIKKKRSEREDIINKNIELLKNNIKEQIGAEFEINGRAKHFYSIYKKMVDGNKEFDEIFDLTAIRIIVNDLRECYSVLGICHTIWNPIPGRFKDYIAMPKSNLYQSLHTTVITNDGETLEIQIRTEEMHRVAEYGIAAHWIYKGGKEENIDKKLDWVREILENQNENADPEEFLDSIKIDLYVNEVFVYTPNGEVFELPNGSTPIDFAYKVHSQVGHQCVGAKVNGKIVPLTYKLSSGEIVSIITKKGSGPSRDWLNIVQSNHAKNRIRRWFKKERHDENVEKGKAILEREMKYARLSLKEDLKDKDEWLITILKRLSLETLEDLYEAIGYGGILTKQVIPRIKEFKKEEEIKKGKFSPERLKKSTLKKRENVGVVVKGLENVLTRFAKCCNPVPGDEIIGYVTQGRGVTIHRVDCPNFVDLEKSKERFIEVEWVDNNAKNAYEAKVKIIGNDRKGLLSEITIIINNENFIVNGLNARKDKKGIATVEMIIEITNKKHLSKLINNLKKVDGVIEVKRVIN